MPPTNPHRKQVRHYEGQLHLHELTFSTFRRLPLLTSTPWRKILAEQLALACQAEDFQLVAFVFMPEHVHLLVLPNSDASQVSRLLGRTKRQTSVAIKALLVENRSSLLEKLTIRERPGQMAFRFWQEGPGFDRNLYSAAAIENSIHYIHGNPVKRGLCRKDEDWLWSSAKYYTDGVQDAWLPPITRPDPSWFHRSGVQSTGG